MKKRWITIAVIIALLMIAAFRYSLVEQDEQLPDKVRTGSLLDNRVLAEEIPTEQAAAPARPGSFGWIVPMITQKPTAEPTAVPTVVPTVVPTAEPTAVPTAEPTAVPTVESSAEPSPTPEPCLKRGDSGAEVKAMQKKLRDLGFLSGAADGRFGEQTEKAVIAFKEHVYEMNQERLAAERAQAEQLAREEAERAAEQGDGASETEEAAEQSGESSGTDGAVEQSGEFSETEEAAEQNGEVEPTEEPVEEKPIFDGVVEGENYHLLVEDGFDVYQVKLTQGVRGAEVMRLQRRLKALGYLSANADGIYGAKTVQAVKAFQRSNSLTQDGIAGEKTQRRLYSDKAAKYTPPQLPAPTIKYCGPYALMVSTKDQRVYAYEWSAQDGAYTKLVRTMVCSTGLADTPTPKGTFSASGPVASWGYFDKYDVWAQYLYRIKGPYLFHSVLYDEADESTLRAGSLYKLGSPASHGCVRLKVEDAKWIYKNCPAGTSVTVY